MARHKQKSVLILPLLLAQYGLAGPVTLSTIPMATSEDMRPNIMLLIDCSASMARNLEGEANNGDSNNRYWSPIEQQRMSLAKAAAVSFVDQLDFARLGYTGFDASGAGKLIYNIVDLNEDTRRQIIEKINHTGAGGDTALATALEGVGQYFSQKIQPGNPAETAVDDSRFKIPLMHDTAGEVAREVIQYYCQKNFIIAMTDGSLSHSDSVSSTVQGSDPSKKDVDYPYGGSQDWSNWYVSDVTHLLNDSDFRPDLKHPNDDDHINNIATYIIGFADAAVYGSNTRIGKMLRDAATGDPTLEEGGSRLQGKFYPTADVAALNDVFNAIASHTTSTLDSVSSLAFNAATLTAETVAYSSSYNTENWAGELAAYAINADGRINRQASWTAASRLDARDAAQRVIYTYYDIEHYPYDLSDRADNNAKGVLFSQDYLTTFQLSDFMAGSEVVSGDYSAQDYIGYIRGGRGKEQSTGGKLRDRGTRLGDIVNSSPVYVGEPTMWDDGLHRMDDAGAYRLFRQSDAIKARAAVVYVGANDGMLHGFNAETGAEVLAYIPASVYSDEPDQGLHYLADVAYAHRFYVDLSPTYADAVINNQWRSVLIGGNRGGGRSIFALDITDPSTFLNTQKAAEDVVLWEFTHRDMGASYSQPQVALMNNNRWAAIFGNGYNRHDNDDHDGRGKLFIVYLDADPTTDSDGDGDGWDEGTSRNADYLILNTQAGDASENNSSRNGLSTPRLYDLDGNGSVDRIYVGDILGDLWVIDVSSKSSANNWRFAYENNGKPKPLYDGDEAITTQAIIVYNSDVADDKNTHTNNLVVLFGTGQFITRGDKTTTTAQHFMGVYDNGTSSGGGITLSDLTPRTTALKPTDPRFREIAPGDKVDWVGRDGVEEPSMGWALTLPTLGERIITTPFVRNQLVYFNTSIPNNKACSSGGSGWQMAVQALDGLTPTTAAFDANDDRVVTLDDPIYSGRAFVTGLPNDASVVGDNSYTKDSENNTNSGKLPSLGNATTRLSWGEIFRSQ